MALPVSLPRTRKLSEWGTSQRSVLQTGAVNQQLDFWGARVQLVPVLLFHPVA
jgi:hypothetical protein